MVLKTFKKMEYGRAIKEYVKESMVKSITKEEGYVLSFKSTSI